ncbi:MAG: YhfC family intramembrane metalloprotease [Chloroflexi bacterium]|nr:YhfC family intramembrane metalloprotease [Chloroflexota bacterium]
MNLDPRFLISYVFAVAFEIIFPLVIGVLIWRRFRVAWRVFLYGALVFLVSQLLTRVPLVQLTQFLFAAQLSSSQVFLYTWFAILALTAGLFEEGGRYLGYRFLIKQDFTWAKGLMYGAGHGGLESMLLVGGLALLGLVNIIAISTMDFSQMGLPPAQLAQIAQARQQIAALDWWAPLLGAYERFVTIFFQIAMSILVLQVFTRRAFLWLWLAIAIHALVDLIAIVLVRQVGAVWTEAALTLTLPLSFGIILYFRPHVETPADEPLPNPA